MRLVDGETSEKTTFRVVDEDFINEMESSEESNVISLDMMTRLDLPAERVLNTALERDLESVIILGYDKEGNEYMSSSMASGPEIIWLMERLKHILISGELEDYI